MAKKWQPTSNTFRILAKRSLKRFYKFTYITIEALHAQCSVAQINTLYQEIHPFCTEFFKAYVVWKSQQGIRIGDTYEQKLKFHALHTTLMPDWHRRIQIAFAPKTPEYTKIFSKGLTPFNNAAYEERLVYFNAIIKNTEPHSTLTQIKDEMMLFRDDIENVRSTKEQSSHKVKASSSQLKHHAEEMAFELYGALGTLMSLYRRNPQKLLNIFPVSLLHTSKKRKQETQKLYDLLLAQNEIKEAGFRFKADQKIMLYNNGETRLRFWFTNNIQSLSNTQHFDLDANAVIHFKISRFAKPGERFLMIQNLSNTQIGSIEIELE
jgi:hypothetical protein